MLASGFDRQRLLVQANSLWDTARGVNRFLFDRAKFALPAVGGTLTRGLVAFAAVAAAPALAQPPAATVITPLKSEQDVNNVNIATGLIRTEVPSLSVPAAPRLKFDRLQNTAPFLRAYLSARPGDYVESSVAVHTGAATSEAWTCIYDDVCTNKKESGSVLEGGIASGGPYIFIESGTGAVYQFNSLRYDNGPAQQTRQVQYYATSITYPDGEVITFAYTKASNTGVLRNHRLAQMSSNTGYSISFSYQSSTVGTNAWNYLAQATLYKTSAPGTPLGQLTYGTANGGYSTTITDLAGRTYTCTGCGSALTGTVEEAAATMQLPTEAANSLTTTSTPLPSGYFGSPTSIVASVTRDGVGWNYAYTNLRLVSNGQTTNQAYSYDKITVAGPNGYNVAYNVSYAGAGVNQIASIVDSIGRTTSYSYDGNFRPTLVTRPEGDSVQVSYDSYGNITSKVSNAKPGSGLAATTESAAINAGNCASHRVLCFRPVSFTDALGRTTSQGYDTAGRLTQRIDPADGAGVQRATYLSYGASFTAPIEVRVCALGSTCGANAEFKTQYTYVGNTPLIATETVIDGVAGTSITTSYTYDDAGRVLVVDGPLPGTDDAKYFRYDTLGRKTWEIGPQQTNGYRVATRTTYRTADDKENTVETGTVTSPSSTTLAHVTLVEMGYDTRRNLVRSVSSAGGTPYTVADTSFDDRGRNLCSTVRMNPAAFATLPADACTLGATGSQGPDRITRNLYDAANQLLQVQKAYGTPLQQNYATYTYTANGRQASVKDANGNLASLGYDGFDRLRQWTFPSKTVPGQVNAADYEAYGYDAVGNRTSLRKRDGRTITYSYDALNRVITKVVPDGSGLPAWATRDVYYRYDVRGLQTSANFDHANGEGVSFVYDGYGRKTGEAISIAGFSKTLGYKYSEAGVRTRVTYPDQVFVNYQRDTTGALYYSDLNSAVPLIHPQYHPRGTVLALYRWVGTGWTVPTTSGYDAIDRPTSLAHGVVGGSVTTTFTYNPASQITTRTRDNDAYRYTGYVGVNRSYAANGLNQYVSAGPAAFGYDGNGNLTSDGTSNYTYDVENRLVAGGSSELRYDPLGRLWQTYSPSLGVTRFLYDGDALVAEYDGAGSMTRRYVHGDGADTPQVEYQGAGVSSPRYLYADHQGSVVATADAGGNVAAINSYDEYGIPAAGNTGRFQYTGQAWLAELGMYYYKARIYSPTLGRFLQIDPIGYDDQVNLYAYVANDPVNGKDPDGLAACKTVGTATVCTETPTGSLIPRTVSVTFKGVGSTVSVAAGSNGVSATARAGNVSVSASADKKGAAAEARAGNTGVGARADQNGASATARAGNLSATARADRTSASITGRAGDRSATLRAGTIQPDKIPAEYRAAQMAQRSEQRTGFWDKVGDFLDALKDAFQ